MDPEGVPIGDWLHQGPSDPREVAGPAPYLPVGYGGTPAVGCYYLTALVS